MIKDQEGTGKRRHQGALAAGEAFAVIKNAEGKLGQVVDISRQGLSFQYIEDGKPASGNVEIDIYISPRKWRIKNIEAEIISDQAMENPVTWSIIRMRRMSVAFLDLTGEQKAMLEDLLAEATTDRRQHMDEFRLRKAPARKESFSAFG